jgi:hypothetical protein
MNIPEGDWRLLRKLHETALQRYCARVLEEYRDVLNRASESPHVRLLELFELTHTRNRQLAGAYYPKRALRILTPIRLWEIGMRTGLSSIAKFFSYSLARNLCCLWYYRLGTSERFRIDSPV